MVALTFRFGQDLFSSGGSGAVVVARSKYEANAAVKDSGPSKSFEYKHAARKRAQTKIKIIAMKVL
jgi:hypothetical protein